MGPTLPYPFQEEILRWSDVALSKSVTSASTKILDKAFKIFFWCLKRMNSLATLQNSCAGNLLLAKRNGVPVSSSGACSVPACRKREKKRSLTVVAAVGELSADSNNYLIAGAAAVALLGTAFPIIFSRKDTCPECDGAGFVRKAGKTLNANAARKDAPQIVCANCNGLGKLNQIDK